ncbi:MAG TPA: malto-oligosyltrehalose trehalohydrolase [Chthoniobacteraceae bacterium]|nr:malto-oligosyltrehalose trehalohydrolase [Chthoniobacteraceae bacterium]
MAHQGLKERKRELLPQGAEIVEGGVRYRVWAPDKKTVTVEVDCSGAGRHESVPLLLDAGGFFHGIHHGGGAGDLYQYRLGGEAKFPDPFSRWQPEGVHGRSMVIDPAGYEWKDAEWKRPAFRDFVIYELHTGTFTPEGTFLAAIEKLAHLRELGVTAIEIMPVADFPGERNWGYDGVSLFAPARCYGRPDDLRALVDAAHGQGLAVVLDVVYNHFGPDGNYIGAYSPYYFTKKHKTPWGDALNVDDDQSSAVREMFIANAIYWLEEFHIDGLRLDATHAIQDDSERHILEEIADVVHERGCYAFAEDERNLAAIVTRKPGGYGLNAVYADDFCHTVQVALGDMRFADEFTGDAAELVDELDNGWLYRGRKNPRTGRPRGTECAHLAPERFLYCISNHDQSGNHAFGWRLNHFCTPEEYRAASALLLLAPYTPQIFMGQEWGTSSPFIYFTDHKAELGRAVSEGRKKEFAKYRDFIDSKKEIPDPQGKEAFLKSKLPWEETGEKPHAEILALYRECLALRMGSRAFRPEGRENWKVANLGMVAVHLRNDHDWLVLVDFKGGHRCSLAEEEFSRLRMGRKWSFVLSTNEKRFGGNEAKSFGAESEVVIFDQPELLVLKSM